MLISELITTLQQASEKWGDIAVYVDMDYGERRVDTDDNPGCLSPAHEIAVGLLPERLVL